MTIQRMVKTLRNKGLLDKKKMINLAIGLLS